MASITIDNVSKSYGEGRAVKDLSLKIEDGEFMVVIGASGCGKSTLLRMIAGLEEMTAGRIIFGDKDVSRLEPKDREVAMVFQNYALYPHKSVYQNLAFGLKMRGMSGDEIRRRVDGAARMLDIAHLLERKPKQLSGGQMQRVALGRALVRHPAVFLLDEPLSNLDAKLRVKMREEIGNLHRASRITMVYVTHDQVEAMTLGDRICVMSDGVLQQVGKPLELYDRPINRFVAGFIGSPEMNFFDAQLSADAGGGAVAAARGLKLEIGKIQGSAGGTVTVGIRPESIRLSAPGAGGGENVGAVSHIEQFGAQTLVFLDCEGTSLRVLLPRNDEIAAGERRAFAFEPSKIHVFDRESGRRINA
ncbi:MAG TPA: ABC transporter ATP-binding protein [Dongiaceae bacterium]|jgi:ABC-type sugar transport system ATPase subunit|nr:ABC transporter ATP-binding protein [Dongiaceae bacterium]